MPAPHMTCLCTTYVRPQMLENAIACFERQSHPADRRELLILDDAGQYPTQPSGPGWRVVSMNRRFATYGEKVNALAGLVDRRTDVLAHWDDDDGYASWHLASHAAAFAAGARWSHPSEVWVETASGELMRKLSGGLFLASSAVTRDLFVAVGGFPVMNSGADQAFAARLRRRAAPADPLGGGRAAYIYRWSETGCYHLSALGADGYDSPKLADLAATAEPVQTLRPRLARPWDELIERAAAASD